MVLIKITNVVVLVLGLILLIDAKQDEQVIKTQQKQRPDPIYSNEFALHIPHGDEMANLIASKHGFVNRGQVSYISII